MNLRAQCFRNLSPCSKAVLPLETSDVLCELRDIDPSNNSASATFTVRCPSLTVRKVSVDGVGTFGFTGTNGIQPHSITTSTAGTAVAGATQTLTAAGVAVSRAAAVLWVKPQGLLGGGNPGCWQDNLCVDRRG